MIFRTYTVISLSACLFAATAAVAESAVVDTKEIEKACNTCGNALSVASLCANTATVSCLQANYASVYDVCAYSVSSEQILSDDVEAQELCANNANVGSVYSNYVQADEFCALKAQFNQLCARQAVIENLCVKDLRYCSPFNARAALSNSYVYTLGDEILFDTIISDPSGSIFQSPTRFVAPDTGVFAITVQIRATGLAGTSIIAGSPVAALELYVNNDIRRVTDTPFLNFNTAVNVFHTTLIFLNQGDFVTHTFQALVMDPVFGFIPYAGQITLIGDSNPNVFRCLFYAQYLGTDCSAIDDCGSVCDMQCPDTPLSPIVCSAREECAPCLQPCMPCGS